MPTSTAVTQISTHMTPLPTPVSALPTATLAVTVAPVTKYSRSQWDHWAAQDGECQDARHEVLIADNLMRVTLKECEVATARWHGAFIGIYIDDPSTLEVDHTVRYDKIVNFDPYDDGFGIMKDNQTAKPQVFRTGDG